jgi:hypothetical protein
MSIHKTITTKREVISGPIDIGYTSHSNRPDLARACLRYDDACGNGHNSFGLTLDGENFGGCMHDEIEQYIPEYADLIKWHLCSTEGPLHYIANTVYWAKEGNIDFARSCAIAPAATLEQLRNQGWLENRLPRLLVEFRAAMESVDWDCKGGVTGRMPKKAPIGAQAINNVSVIKAERYYKKG